MKQYAFVFALFTLVTCVTLTHAQVIGHKEVASVKTLTLAQLSKISGQSWLFTHASVGANMINGMKKLHREDSGHFSFQIKRVKLRDLSQISEFEKGYIYEIPRGNPGWRKKYNLFEKMIQETDLSQGNVVAMDKLCFIDQSADVQVYLKKMNQLEKNYPKVTFVYTTMPIMTDENQRNVQRHQYNQTLRAYALKHHKLLYDIADIESHSPDGKAATFIYEGEKCQKLYKPYTGDGGHLNNQGSKQVAMGWYAVALAIANKTKSQTP